MFGSLGITAAPQTPCPLNGGLAGRPPMSRGHWIVLSSLAFAEVVSALYLASINPAQGYDETWYLLNALHIRGVPSLPYHCNRPPMLPLLLAAFGPYYKLVPALAHMGSTALIFLILRRLVSPSIAIAGLAVFMACGELRMYNVLILTEMPSILFLLLAIYAFVVRSPLLVGGALALAVLTNWSMATAPPVVFLLYAMRRQWRECATFTYGLVLAWIPFLIVFAVAYGNPLAPFLAHLRIQRQASNDWAYYLKLPHWLPIALIFVSGVAAWWVWVNRHNRKVRFSCDLYVLLLGMVLARLVLLQAVTPKSVRYLVPLIPVLLLLSVSMIWHYGRRWRRLQWVLCGVLLVTVLPGKRLYHQIYGWANHPAHAIAEFGDVLAALSPTEPIYTDVNDLAVMGQTVHPTVAVTGPGSSHRMLVDRPTAARAEIPDGALYLTWDPGGGVVLARNTVPRGETLWLVRWRRGTTARQEPSSP